jgi:hypothetical protein
MHDEDKLHADELDKPILIGGSNDPESDNEDESEEQDNLEDDPIEDDSDEEESDDDDGQPAEATAQQERADTVDGILEIEGVREYIDDLKESREMYIHRLEMAKKGDRDIVKELGFKSYPLIDESTNQSVNIYALSQDDFDVYVNRMDATPGFDKALILEIIKSRAKYDAKMDEVTEKINLHVQQSHAYEWQIIVDRAPGTVKKHEKQIADWIQAKLNTDPVSQKRAETFQGKQTLVKRAIQELKLMSSKEPQKPDKKPAPAPHTVTKTGGSKRTAPVPRFNAEAIREMSAEDFKKHEASIMRQYGLNNKKGLY